MKHPTSHLLHAYWEKLRGDRAAPERAEIEPGEIRHLLADSLILELDVPARSAVIRLAGTRVCALYGRELRGQSFDALWGDRACDAWRLAETVALDTLGVVAGLRGVNRAEEGVDLELLLLPLRHRGRPHVRALGALSFTGAPAWLGLKPVVRAETTSLRILAPRPRNARPPAAGAGEGMRRPLLPDAPIRRGHLLVHPGGRA
ncbi:PAS domain-containing protein [Methylobacterium sp. J-076]|uniref:PAS domain-containing protein n=1 Tax=Methylobacterium sp. J-076 TaxID=2836655 RepID=UPI001FB9C17C|nr:PAS domain-containing protein [Methylobacterium sp. J-076]MCJ2011323.1 PAS domain-containing protein [Methylobacterium sp. J-076]